jgi:hypothetical protein
MLRALIISVKVPSVSVPGATGGPPGCDTGREGPLCSIGPDESSSFGNGGRVSGFIVIVRMGYTGRNLTVGVVVQR